MNRYVGLTLAAALAATGCKGDDTDDTDVVDTDDTDDTDVEIPADASFLAPDAPVGASVTLSWVDITTFGEGMPAFDAVPFAHAAVEDGVAAFRELGAPPPAKMYSPEPEQFPDLKLAIYIPAMHVDADADGVPSGDEPFVGLAATWLVYVEGGLPPEFAAAGFQLGWNGIYMDLSGDGGDGIPPAVGKIDVPLPLNLAAAPTLTIGGDVAFEVDTGSRLAVLAGEEFSGAIVDLPLTDPWSLTLAGPPDASFIERLPESPIRGAIGLPVAYSDADVSGDWSDGDMWLGTPCYDDFGTPRQVAVAWFEPPTDSVSAVFLSVAGFGGAGWNALANTDDGPLFLDASALADVTLTGACGF